MKVLFLMLLLSFTIGEEPPEYLIRGIMEVETRSYVKDTEIVYVDRRVGAKGEVGPTQIGRDVCIQHGFDRDRIRNDPNYALECTVIHLKWLHSRLDTWDLAGAWNGGIGKRHCEEATIYANKVHRAEQRIRAQITTN